MRKIGSFVPDVRWFYSAQINEFPTGVSSWIYQITPQVKAWGSRWMEKKWLDDQTTEVRPLSIHSVLFKVSGMPAVYILQVVII